jgi:hypothetical protein
LLLKVVIIIIRRRRNEAEKILKYTDLVIKIQRMWNVRAQVIPVITGGTETISESLST